MIPEHVRVEPYGLCYRGKSVKQYLRVRNTPIGVLHELSGDRWGFDDAILGRSYIWNTDSKEMRAFLAKRCRPDFPDSQVAELHKAWRALQETHGRFDHRAETARETLVATVDGNFENPGIGPE